MIFHFGDIIYQIANQKSGEVRPGRTDRYDAPLAPSQTLLDDINHVVISWEKLPNPFSGAVSTVKVKGYTKSHHTT